MPGIRGPRDESIRPAWFRVHWTSNLLKWPHIPKEQTLAFGRTAPPPSGAGPSGLVHAGMGASAITEKGAPRGSAKTANLPTFLMSIGGTLALPPRLVAFDTTASQSVTWK